ncbi:LysR family transcriptional regulator [Ferribacterium limneticum]|uniref:LysR family transcriptional regulator n=1 Tax=Ferribacterium limneticum TaxID=76259 RepID=UPI001CFBBC55|nr:LysR family transcriptional regulator [Ferribacterium limneticum]UCV29861.1 LysR family transcriptional regulator [Ferribacterium limneticum]UCV33780.1 LysR family transcriptional regulator [Ferribacterium limneticum]
MPSFRQIHYFLTVADLGGFTQAAGALFIAQSALSRQVSQLEEELGFLLFEREPRGVRLTPAGAVYRERVSSIPATLAFAADEGRQLARGEAGLLRLLHSSTIPAASLMPVLDRFMAASPKARIDLDRASSEQQVSLVANGSADVGVIRLPVLRRDSRVHFVELVAERLWVALADDHRMAKQESIVVAHLQDERFVSAVYRERGGLARVVTDLCLKRGFVPNTAQIVSPKTSMLNLVAAKKGIAIVPERMTTLGGHGIAYVPLSDEDARSTCALVLPLKPTLLGQKFADILIQESQPIT